MPASGVSGQAEYIERCALLSAPYLRLLANRMPLEQLGPYRIERMLGRGGMGAVYVGVHLETGERHALKVLAPTLADDAGFRERFKTEIETLKKLRHPNIVQLFGYGEHDGHLFYAMELVEGRNLQDEMQSGRRFDWREVCRIGIAICQGLKHAHDVGVIHRDLKPANLLITPDGHIKLSDFGIAKLYGMSQLTGDGGVLGTADYMAPEQADGRPVTTRCDMYSLGSVLFALLARRPPFAAPTLAEVLHALKYDEPPPVRRYAPQTPEALESILNSLLDKDPQNRIATPLVLSNRLKAMLHALSEDRTSSSAEPDDFVIRLEDDVPPPAHIAQRTTLSPPDSSSDVAELPATPTRPMTSVPARESAAAATASPPSRHFTVVDNRAPQQREALTPAGDDSMPTWAILAAAAVLVIIVASLAYYFTIPPSADDLYARITQAALADDPAQLAEVEPQIDQFLAHYGSDARYGEVANYQQELEVYRLQRRLEFRARRLRGAESLLPVEQAYLDAMNFERSAPETAIARLEALIDVYGGDPHATRNTSRCVELARRQLATLRERHARSGEEHEQVLTARLQEARNNLKEHPHVARRICEGIVTLYAEKPWAEKPVREARAMLEALDSGESTAQSP